MIMHMTSHEYVFICQRYVEIIISLTDLTENILRGFEALIYFLK